MHLIRSIFLVGLILILLCRLSLYAQKQGKAALDSMLNELTMAKDDTNKTKLFYRIAEQYNSIDQLKYLEYVNLGMGHAVKMDFKRAIAAFEGSKANYFSNIGKYDSAFFYHHEAYKLNESMGDKRGMALSLVDMSSYYSWQSNYIEALKYLMKAIPMLEGIKDFENLSIAYSNIAAAYSSQEDSDKALYYELKALKIAVDHNITTRYGRCFNSIGLSYKSRKDTAKANYYLKKALIAYQDADDYMGIADVYRNLSNLETNDYDKKLNYMTEAEEIWEVTGPMHPLAISNLGSIAEFYLTLSGSDSLINLLKEGSTIPHNKNKLLTLADQYVTKAIKYSKETKAVQNEMYYYGVKATIEAEKGNFKRAFFNLTANLKLYDSLYSQESKNKIAAITSQREIDLRDKEIELQQLTMRQFWLYVIIAAVIAAALSGFLWNRSRINALRLKNKLQQQEAEQHTNALILQKKLSESELTAIRSQMNPHFIFNVLNSIESFILENDARTASRLVQKFAGLSRLILENSTQSLVPIEREWKALRLYTELEAMRYENKFKYLFEADPEIDWDTTMVPPMLVQPLIENAIHHGLRHLVSRRGELKIKVYLEEQNQLIFEVIDNGIGYRESAKIKSSSKIKERSMGIAGIQERIISINNQLNGAGVAQFEIVDHLFPEGNGVTAIIKLPVAYHIQQAVGA